MCDLSAVYVRQQEQECLQTLSLLFTSCSLQTNAKIIIIKKRHETSQINLHTVFQGTDISPKHSRATRTLSKTWLLDQGGKGSGQTWARTQTPPWLDSGCRAEGVLARIGSIFSKPKCDKWRKWWKGLKLSHTLTCAPPLPTFHNPTSDLLITVHKMNTCEWRVVNVNQHIMTACNIAWGGSTLPGDELILTGGPATQKQRSAVRNHPKYKFELNVTNSEVGFLKSG